MAEAYVAGATLRTNRAVDCGWDVEGQPRIGAVGAAKIATQACRIEKRDSTFIPLGNPVPVRLPDDILAQVQARALADDRSVSSWIRRAIEHELSRPA